VLPRESRILIVDDLKLVRKIIMDTLVDLGFPNVDEASDGADAFRKLEEALANGKPFSLVFCDWNMPLMTGFDFLLKCRANVKFQDLPVIMVTAESEQGNVLKAIKAGANDYLVKPLSKASLQKKLERLDAAGVESKPPKVA
jgi:two-component system chemotaxis response regulator CheY